MARVLFLEDEEDLVLYLPRLLKQKGLQVIGTKSIGEALDRFAKEDFDAVLLDIMMSPAEDMDAEALNYGRETGIEVACRMKDINPDVPIVAFTVLTNPEVKSRLREAGVSAILNKPSETEQIAEALWRAISARGGDAKR